MISMENGARATNKYCATHMFNINEAYDVTYDVDPCRENHASFCIDARSGNYFQQHDENAKREITVDPRRLSVADLAPHIDHYRNIISVKRQGSKNGSNRPSLAELHLQAHDLPDENLFDGDSPKTPTTPSAPTLQADKKVNKAPVKFGWITGVLVRCTLSILGAVLYLRLSWITGHAGVALTTLIVLISYLVTTVTAISMCAISTNGEIRGGGAYYMLSRSLGPEFGGSMGVMFSIANAFAVALHVVGFAETLRDLLKSHSIKLVDGGVTDIRILGLATLVLLMCIVIIGVDFELKAQLALLVILALSYVNFVVGTFLPPSEFKRIRGVTGYSWKTFTDNIAPDWRDQNFYSLFAIYFPSATGIMAGANISGDLKEPSKAIPKGTLLALLVTFLMYIGAIWLPAATVVREASGEIVDLTNATAVECTNNNDTVCEYGLLNHVQMIEVESAFGPLVTAGIFAATLSSALASLVSSPKLLQAVGRDRIFPLLHHLAKGYGRNNEPRRAYFIAFLISMGMVCVGDLNAIAPFISNFYLANYALVNYACFDCSLAKSHGWRPSFRYYNKWLSLLGAILCVAAMFLMSWWSALLTFVFVLCLYVYILRSKPDVNWGSSSQARIYNGALQGMLKLLITEEHVKNYRPQILVLCGNPVGRAALVDFARNITGHKSLLMLGHIVISKPSAAMYACLKKWTTSVYSWLQKRSVKAFYVPVSASNMIEGLRALLQVAGLGKLRPNIIVLGFKNNWQRCTSDQISEYFQLIHEAFDCQMAVGVLHVRGGLDYLEAMREQRVCDAQNYISPEISTPVNDVCISGVFLNITDETVNHSSAENGTSENAADSGSPELYVKPRRRQTGKRKKPSVFILGTETVKALASTVENFDLSLITTSTSQRQVLASVNQFKAKAKNAIVDVWWLADDGGLTLLIPYILTHQRSYVTGAKLRIFTSASGKQTIEQEQKSIAALLHKFRIEFSDVFVLPDLSMAPKLSTVVEFNEMIAPFKVAEQDPKNIFITSAEVELMRERTYRHLRVRELLLHYSRESSLTVVSMPVPRRGGVSASLYMAWLETLVKDLSPILLIRGNQQSVLTFYS